MYECKKREDHAESDRDWDEDDGGRGQQIDFAWLVFMGMQMGYTEKEVSRMYLGKWSEMFAHFKQFHNFKMKRGIYQERVKVSLFDL